MNLLLFQKKRLSKGIRLALDFMGGNLDSRISFSRGSNATVVGSNGLIQYAPHNLLTYSEQFDNAAWATSGCTISANTTIAPDATSTADRMVEGTGAVDPRLPVNVTTASGITLTLSVHVKEVPTSAKRYLNLTFNSGFSSPQGAVFDLGIIEATTVNAISSSITPIGNGWYRCSVTTQLTTSTVQSFRIRSTNTNSTSNITSPATFTGDGVSGLFIWGAQLNQGELQPYYSTTVKNLLEYSQNFENAAWTKSNSSIAASTVIGPFGFDGGQKMVENTTASVGHYIQPLQSPSFTVGQVLTYSVYTKAAERTFLQLILTGVGSGGANLVAGFDIVNGIAGTPNAGTSTIVSLGNGWFRCSFTISVLTAAATGAQIRLSADSSSTPSSYTGDGTSGIYIFGAQLSDSASLDPYSYNPVAAPTSTAYYGPRFDYDPVTLAPKGLLIEEQRTNLLTYSSEFENTAWLKARSTIITNAITAPDGSITADKLVEDTTASNTHNVSQLITTIASTTYTLSCYLKKGERSWAVLVFNNAGVYPAVYIDLNSGVIGNISGNITATISPIGAGWYRCTATVIATSTNLTSYILTSIGNGNQVYTGDGTSGIYLWGAQLEAGAFPTSYIPTTSATVTRAADNVSMVGTNFSSWYNQSEGTIAANVITTLTTGYIASIMRASGYGPRLQLSLAGVANTTGAYVVDDTVTVVVSLSRTGLNSAFAYKSDDYALSANASVVTDTAGAVPTGIIQAKLGQSPVGDNYLNGHIKSFKYYPTRLPNADLQRLTR